ncbi:pyridoxine biosynthesis protein [Allomyces arbusculus]|nr:pyridoxine biosynthesis protein [Allomyces arbusculus]
MASLASRRFLHASARRYFQPLMMPALSPTMTEGAIVRWNIKEGQTFSAGDILFEVETDKAQLEVDAQDDGVLAKIMVPAGTKGVQVNSPIAVLADEGEDIASLDMSKFAVSAAPAPTQAAAAPPAPAPPAAAAAPAAPPAPATAAPARPAAVATANPGQKRHPHISPAVSHLIHLYDLSDATVATIPATGPQGRLLKGDVLAFVQAGKLPTRTVVHPEPIAVAAQAPIKSCTLEVPVHKRTAGAKDVAAALATAKVPVRIVVDGKPVAGKKDASAEVQLKVDGVHRVRKPEPAYSLKSKAAELEFIEYLSGARTVAPGAAVKAADAEAEAAVPTPPQDLYDFLGNVPAPNDPRFHSVLRVHVANAKGVNPKELETVVETVRGSLAATL